MTEAQKILNMIEAVDENDTDTLDEIDARFFCYYNQYIYLHNCNTVSIDFKYSVDGKNVQIGRLERGAQYTRSRDAQKVLEHPEDRFTLSKGKEGYRFTLHNTIDRPNEIMSSILQTEELVRLSVRIQEIDYERNNEND